MHLHFKKGPSAVDFVGIYFFFEGHVFSEVQRDDYLSIKVSQSKTSETISETTTF